MNPKLSGIPEQEKLVISKQIVGLDALRISAAFMVLAFHLCFWLWLRAPDSQVAGAFHPLAPFVWFGWIGVEVFFVISGFVITYSAQNVSASTFLQHRFTRLSPTAVICATLTAAIVFFFSSHAPVSTLVSLWFHSIAFLPGRDYIDDSYWTLPIEISFYALVYVLLQLKRFDRVQLVMSVIGSLSTLYWVATMFGSHFFGEAFPRSWRWLQFLGNQPVLLLQHGCYFTVGVFLWFSLFRGVTWKRVSILCICIGGGIPGIIHMNALLTARTGVPRPSIVPIAVWLGSIGFVIVATRANHVLHRAIGRNGIAMLRGAGLMTYPLYLLHQKIGHIVMQDTRGSVGNFPALAIAFAVDLVLAYVVTMYLEPPLRTWIKSILPTLDRSSKRQMGDPETPIAIPLATIGLE